MSVWAILGIMIGIFLVFSVISWTLTYMTKQYRLVSNPENNARIRQEALTAMESRYLGHGRATLMNGPVAQIPEVQRLLINTDVFSCRYAGYLGPLSNGIYSEDDAVRIACEAGARLFVVEVGMRKDHVTPMLVAYKDGAHVGNTYGSIKAVADALKRYAFMYGRSDPLMVYVHVYEHPDISVEPNNYFTFCRSIAQQLGGLESYLLGDSPQGSYSRRGREDQLFFTPLKELSNSVILMTNLDTTCFRKTRDYGISSVKASEDLDLMVHARVYTEGAVTDKKPAVFAAEPYYWLSTPKNMTAETQKNTKEAYSIVLDTGVGSDDYKKLRETYGVHSVAFSLFQPIADYIIGSESAHYKDSWLAKPDALRFKPAEPIVVLPPDPRMNANKGILDSPTI